MPNTITNLLEFLKKHLTRIFRGLGDHNRHRYIEVLCESRSKNAIKGSPEDNDLLRQTGVSDDFTSLFDIKERPVDWYKELHIYIIGLGSAKDIFFYLGKGFKVIAIDTNPLVIDEATKTFHDYTLSGRLVLLNTCICKNTDPSPGNSPGDADATQEKEYISFSYFVDHSAGLGKYPSRLIEIFNKYGEPYCLIINRDDISEMLIDELSNSDIFPPYLSIKVSLSSFEQLTLNNYSRFKLTAGRYLEMAQPKYPSREGLFVGLSDLNASVVPFGEDTPGDWKTFHDLYVEISNMIDPNTGEVNPALKEHTDHKDFIIHARHRMHQYKINKLIHARPIVFYNTYPMAESRMAEGGIRVRNKDKTEFKKNCVSVITVVKNNANTIERCLLSVQQQSYRYLEHIVIDGGSTDGTLDVLLRHENKLEYFISENDNGLYEAMNKGIQCAKGEYIAIINSDDWLEPDGLSVSVKAMEEHIADFSIGYANVINEKGDNFHTWKIGNFDERIFVSGMSFCHQALIARKHCFEVAGLFDTDYKLTADYKWVKNLYTKGLKPVFIDKPVVNFSYTGLTVSARPAWKAECAFQLRSRYPDLEKNEVDDLIEFIYRDGPFKQGFFHSIRKMKNNKQFMLSFSLFLSQRIMEYEERLGIRK